MSATAFRPVAVLAATSAALVLAASAGCSAGSPTGQPASGSHITMLHPARQLPSVEAVTGVVHVHGLGVGPTDDAGETRERVSLHGEADFHALVAAHGQVFGYDSTSGPFMVTADRKRWDRRSRLPMRDFAVDPADPDGIVAMTEQGAARLPGRAGRTSTRRGPGRCA